MLTPSVASAVASASTALLVFAEGVVTIAVANPVTVGAVAVGVGGYCLYNALLTKDKAQAYSDLKTKLNTGNYLPNNYDNNEDNDTIGIVEKKKHGNIDPKLKGKFASSSAQSATGMPEPDDEEPEKESKNERKTNCEKSESPVWKELKHYRGEIKTNGLTGKNKRYYHWDNLHNEIEMYDSRGKPLDAIDPVTGRSLNKNVKHHRNLKL